MSLTQKDLNGVFNEAIEDDSDFVFIGIEAENVREFICIPKYSFNEKQEFYNRSYTEKLVHVMNKNVFIYELSHGKSSELDNIC